MNMMNNAITIPDSLPYPRIQPFNKVPELRNLFCYVIRHYQHVGTSYTITRDKEHVCVRVADFDGNFIEPDSTSSDYKDVVNEIMLKYVSRLIVTMKLCHVPKSQYYFAGKKDPILVDMRLSLNKFVGPGFLYDIFGKQGIPIQEKLGAPLKLDEDGMKKISNGTDGYIGNKFIFKPSVFKSMMRSSEIAPLYGVYDHEVGNAS